MTTTSCPFLFHPSLSLSLCSSSSRAIFPSLLEGDANNDLRQVLIRFGVRGSAGGESTSTYRPVTDCGT